MTWSTVKLGEVVSFRGGGTPRKDNPEYWSDEIPWATVKDFKSLILDKTQDSISRQGLESSASNLIPAGHVIIPTRMALGKAAINAINLAINQDLRALIPKRPLDPRFLLHAMLGLADVIERNGAGATVKGITQAKLSELRIPLPPLAEQRRIAGILDAADALRAKRRESLAQLDLLLQSTFLDMFGDPVTNPMGWEMVQIEDIGDVQGGLQVTSKRYSLPIIRPYLRVANVFRGYLLLDEIKTIRLTEAEERRTGLEDEDILIVEGHGNKEEIGRCARWDGSIEQCVHQNHLIRLRCDRSRILPIYAESFINSKGGRRGLAGTSRTTSGLNTISVSKVKATAVALPPLSLQHRFASIVESVEQQKATQHTHLAELDTLFASLQQRAFNGELTG